jgi:hypothetical protein
MNSQNKKINIIVYILLFYLLLLCLGIFFAYWLGMGWFFMFHTIGVLIASSPRLYIILFGPLLNKDTLAKLIESEIVKKPQFFLSKSAIALNLINIVVTILAFWKINVPIKIAVEAIFH